MTRLATPLPLPATPITVRLTELAIASGVVGFPVALCYQEFPAPLLSQVWKHFIQSAGPDDVHHIHTQRELNKLPGRIGQVRLVLVHAARLHIPTAWLIQLAESVDGESGSRPAVFSRFVPDDLDDDPGATLLLQCPAQEATAVARWLSRRGNTDGEGPLLPDAISVRFPAWLSSVLSPDSRPDGHGRQRFRNHQILRGLLAGVCVLRSANDSDRANLTGMVSRNDYESVRTLLQSPVLVPADTACDPLATAMVNRANVYFAAGSGDVRRYGIPFLDHEYDQAEYSSGRSRKELITRREVADLGNVRSGMVRRLVEYLHQGADGYQWYCRMGLVRQPPNRDAWGPASVDSLAANLRPWSVKQVRTHFDRLLREGLITAEREAANGPWRYELPEELTAVSSPFRNLPPAEELHRDEPNASGNVET